MLFLLHGIITSAILNLFSGYYFDERVQTENSEKENLWIIDKFITHDVYIATFNNDREKKPLLT